MGRLRGYRYRRSVRRTSKRCAMGSGIASRFLLASIGSLKIGAGTECRRGASCHFGPRTLPWLLVFFINGATSSRCSAARPACGRSRRPPAIDGAGNRMARCRGAGARGVRLPGRYDRQGDHRARATAARLSGGSTPLQSRSTAEAKIKHRGKQNAQAALHRGNVDLVTEDGSGNTVAIENWLEKSREARRHGIDLHRRRESLLPCGHVPSPRFSLLPDSLSFE